jgi:hypothetical protein
MHSEENGDYSSSSETLSLEIVLSKKEGSHFPELIEPEVFMGFSSKNRTGPLPSIEYRSLPIYLFFIRIAEKL